MLDWKSQRLGILRVDELHEDGTENHTYDPPKIASGLEMFRFFAGSIFTDILFLEGPMTELVVGKIDEDEYRNQIRGHLESLKRDAARCRMHSFAERAGDLLEKWIPKEPNPQILVALMSQMIGDFQKELTQDLFFRIPRQERTFYEDIQLSAAAADAFPSVVRDMKSAGRCFALDECTACILHLLRALETPLTVLANALQVTISNPNWHLVLRDCETQIATLEKQDREFYGGVALTFRFFKDALRNRASHGHDNYDKREAYDAMRGVAAFLDELAKRLREGPVTAGTD